LVVVLVAAVLMVVVVVVVVLVVVVVVIGKCLESKCNFLVSISEICERFVEIMFILLADNSYSDNVRENVHCCYVCKIHFNLLGSNV